MLAVEARGGNRAYVQDGKGALDVRNAVIASIARGKFNEQELAQAHFVPVWTSAESSLHKLTEFGNVRAPFMHVSAHFEDSATAREITAPSLKPTQSPTSAPEAVRAGQAISLENDLVRKLMEGHKYPVLKHLETEWKSADKYPFYQHVAQAAGAAAHTAELLVSRSMDDDTPKNRERAEALRELERQSYVQAREAIAKGPSDRQEERAAFIDKHLR